MRRAALSVLLVAAAVVLQLTVVNRLTLPGGGAPDLVLLVVIALALCGGPAAGALTGFCAGLSLDLAPPASQRGSGEREPVREPRAKPRRRNGPGGRRA